MSLTIRTSTDLKDEILRLEGVEKQQSLALKARFNSPSAIFTTLFSLFSNTNPDDPKSAGLFNQDFVGLLSRLVLPLALNKTLFRHSNFLVKALVGIISQKASNYISEDSVANVWGKAKSVIESFNPKNPGGILNTVKSIFAGKKAKQPAVNHPAYISSQQNVLKADV
ncbi:MAG TPA: hypothetical protein VGC01_07250 [Mucilaginibacter sp.]